MPLIVCRHTTMKQRQIGNFKWHQCTYCGKEFKKPSDLVRHTRIHTQEKPYKVVITLVITSYFTNVNIVNIYDKKV